MHQLRNKQDPLLINVILHQMHRLQLSFCQKREIASIEDTTESDFRSVAEIQPTINNTNSYLYF